MKSLAKLLLCLLFLALFFQCQTSPSTDEYISPEKMYNIVYDSSLVSEYVVFDLRDRMDYVRGHLVSAFWLSPDSIIQKLPAMMNERRPIILYDADGTQSPVVARMLKENGVEKLHIMSGGFSRWTELGYPAAIQLVRNTSEKVHLRKKDLSVAAAHALLNNLNSDFALIDVRPYPVFAERHIEGAISIPYVPLNEFVVGVEERNFKRNQSIIIYCDRLSDIGNKAADVMLRNDFSQVYLLQCDITEWAQ